MIVHSEAVVDAGFVAVGFRSGFAGFARSGGGARGGFRLIVDCLSLRTPPPMDG